ncbi:MAG: tetratricopeptide repeat protein [Microcoleaceae cyanobacterium]
MIYTNVDIALQANFYTEVAKFIGQGYDAFVINRRTISDSYQDVIDIPLMYGEKGNPHPDHDCFIFKRSVYPKFRLGLICIGARWVGRCLYINCLLNAEKFAEFKDLYLTFHLGDRREWGSDKFNDYHLHNQKEMGKIMREYQENMPLPNHPILDKTLAVVMQQEMPKTNSNSLTTQDYIEQADNLFKGKKFSQAVEYYQKAIELNPRQPRQFYQQLFENFLKNDLNEAAEIIFDNLIKKLPKNPMGYEWLAKLAMQTQNWELALERWNQGLKNFPRNFEFLRRKANTLVKRGKVSRKSAVSK